jgi:hypothetical protein
MSRNGLGCLPLWHFASALPLVLAFSILARPIGTISALLTPTPGGMNYE